MGFKKIETLEIFNDGDTFSFEYEIKSYKEKGYEILIKNDDYVKLQKKWNFSTAEEIKNSIKKMNGLI